MIYKFNMKFFDTKNKLLTYYMKEESIMLQEQRMTMFFEMNNDSSEKADSILTKIIDKIKDIITKIKKFFREKILNKFSSVPDEIDIDEGVYKKIKEAVKNCSDFLSKGTKKGVELVKKNKVPLILTAVLGIVSFMDYQNSKTYKLAKSEYTNCINRCDKEIDRIEKAIHQLESSGKMTSAKRKELHQMHREAMQIKRGQEEALESLPEYLTLLERILKTYHKAANTLSSFTRRKGNNNG